MEDLFTSLSTYGYVILFFYSLGGGFLAILAASVLSFSGELNIYATIAVAFLGNMLGDNLLFWMTRYQKKDFHSYMLKYRRHLALSHLLMRKYGSWVIFIQKYIYGVKTLVPIAMALTKYKFKTFVIWNIFASALWALVFGMGGYLSGQILLNFYSIIQENPYTVPLILLLILGTIAWYFNRITSKKIVKK